MTTETAISSAAADAGATDTANTNTQDPAANAADQTQNNPADNQDAGKQDSDQTNPTDQKDSDSDGDKNQNEQKSNEPVEYADYELPEGFEMTPEVKGKFDTLLNEVAKENGAPLSQEAAQKFVTMGANLVQEAVEGAMKYAADYHAQRTEEWIKTFQNDPEIGGDEAAQKKTLSEAKRVVVALGGDSLMKAIDETGAGDHPEVIRAFYKLRSFIGEDGKVIVANQGGGSSSLAQRLYPNQQKT